MTTAATMTDEQERIRADFMRRRGYWADDWQLILEMAPQVMAAYTDMSAYSAEHGTLDAKTREFMYIATTASVTHIHPIGIETHGRNAIRAGATATELITLLALVSGLGVVGYRLAVEVLEEVAPGSTGADGRTAESVEGLRARYAEVFGECDDGVELAMRADPAFFATFLQWAASARVSGVLSPRVVALVAIVINASVTHLDRRTLTREIRAALAIGVSPAEIAEVCQLTSGVSVHSLTVGAPIIAGLFAEPTSA